MASACALVTNIDRATAAWGTDMPGWVRLLASACDVTNQRQVGDRLQRSSGWVSRVINRSYGGGYEEAETIVRAAYGNEDVACPLWGPIPLAQCMRNRRQNTPPQNQAQRAHKATCPTCPNNTDRAAAAEEE